MAACCGGICCQDGTTICLLPGHDVCTAFWENIAPFTEHPTEAIHAAITICPSLLLQSS
jgi:hypothetical protein